MVRCAAMTLQSNGRLKCLRNVEKKPEYCWQHHLMYGAKKVAKKVVSQKRVDVSSIAWVSFVPFSKAII